MDAKPIHPSQAWKKALAWRFALRTPSGICSPFRRFISSTPTHTTLSELSRARAAFTWAKSIRHIRESLPPSIRLARFTGISRIRVTARGSNSRVKFLLRPSPRRPDAVHHAVLATAPSRQRANDHTLLVDDIEMPPLHRLVMVVTGNRGRNLATLLRPQRNRLLQLQHEPRGPCIKPLLDYTPSHPKYQQLSKLLLQRHRRSSSCGRQASLQLHRKQRGNTLLIGPAITYLLFEARYRRFSDCIHFEPNFCQLLDRRNIATVKNKRRLVHFVENILVI